MPGDILADWQRAHLDQLYDRAHRYLDLGWSLIPLGMNRRPLSKWRHAQEERITADDIDDWFTNGVELTGGVAYCFNLGIVTGAISGIVVVDCDNAEAEAAARELGLHTPFSARTSRGRHFYWAHPGDGRYHNHAGGNPGRFGEWPSVPGLDFRGDGGYVVAPGSLAIKGDERRLYEWDEGPSLEDLSPDIPAYRWRRRTFAVAATAPVDADQAVQSQLMPVSLAGVKPQGEERLSLIQELGGQLVQHGGRNHALARYVGECVASGVVGDDLLQAAAKFVQDHCVDPGSVSDEEILATVRSIEEKDRRDHPERYVTPTPTPLAKTVFSVSDVPELEKLATGAGFYMYPLVPIGSAVMLCGFSGHGKSLFLYHLLYACCAGRDFCAFEYRRHARVLYFDLENSLTTIIDRLKALGQVFPDRAEKSQALGYRPTDDLKIVSPQLLGKEINFRSDEDLAFVEALVKEHQPNIVVIDTIRTAWTGFEENKAQEWGQVNSLVLALRNVGITVILTHHTNKPAEVGKASREAGSSNQLTVMETVAYISEICESGNEEYALRKGAAYDQTGFEKLEKIREVRRLRQNVDLRPRLYSRLSFGKLRNETDGHQTSHIAFGSTADGDHYIWGSTTLRKRIRNEIREYVALHNARPTDAVIAARVEVNPSTVAEMRDD